MPYITPMIGHSYHSLQHMTTRRRAGNPVLRAEACRFEQDSAAMNKIQPLELNRFEAERRLV